MTNKIKNYLNNNMVLSRYGRDLISKNNKVKNAYDRNFFNTKKQTMVSKEEVDLEGRKRLFDVHQGIELQAMAEETASVVVVEKRAALWERIRHLPRRSLQPHRQ